VVITHCTGPHPSGAEHRACHPTKGSRNAHVEFIVLSKNICRRSNTRNACFERKHVIYAHKPWLYAHMSGRRRSSATIHALTSGHVTHTRSGRPHDDGGRRGGNKTSVSGRRSSRWTERDGERCEANSGKPPPHFVLATASDIQARALDTK
jgi:hypothetical protein